MKAVILAGGKGTRLGELTKEIPKPLIPIDNKPILEHQINVLKRYNITDILILIGHLGEQIQEYFGNGEKFGVNIEYYKEEKPLGTTGAFKEVEHLLTEDFIVFYGDVMLDMDVSRLIKFHKEKSAAATLVIHPNDHPHDSDLVEIDESERVTKFHSKPHDQTKFYSNLVNAAVYVFSPKILSYVERGVKADFGKHIFPKIVDKEPIFGYNTPEYIKDMGTPDRLEKVTNDFISGKIRRLNLDHKRPAIFLDRDGVINEEVHLLHKLEQFKLLPNTAEAIKAINKSDFLAVVVTNQPVVARNMCSIEAVQEVHKKMETLLGKEGAKLDAIYFCPHHPDKGFPEENPVYKIPCECRKPGIGMIKKAAADLNIDLSRSFIVGDSERDILCGKNAGLTTIGVRTGYGCKETSAQPDFMFDDLFQAATFLTKEEYKETFSEIKKKFDEKIDKEDKEKKENINNGNSKNKEMNVKTAKPFVVSVGGNTRAGKSTFSNYLAKKFEEDNKRVLNICLDNWILGKQHRKPHHSVFDRFQMQKIEENITQLFKEGYFSLSTENTVAANKDSSSLDFSLTDKDVVIISGVVSLSSPILRNMADLKIFYDSTEDSIKKRVHNYYSWKGLNSQEIDQILAARGENEYVHIKDDKAHADIVLNNRKD